MRFDNFSFDAIQIDGSTYEHDVSIDRGEIRKRKKEPSRDFESNSATRRSRSKRKSSGNAANSSSVVVHTADCPSCREYSAKPIVTKSTCYFYSPSRQSRC